MGIQRAFTSGADISDMLVNSKNIGISDVMHQAYIEVDERETEAAAATGNIPALTKLPVNSKYY